MQVLDVRCTVTQPTHLVEVGKHGHALTPEQNMIRVRLLMSRLDWKMDMKMEWPESELEIWPIHKRQDIFSQPLTAPPSLVKVQERAVDIEGEDRGGPKLCSKEKRWTSGEESDHDVCLLAVLFSLPVASGGLRAIYRRYNWRSASFHLWLTKKYFPEGRALKFGVRSSPPIGCGSLFIVACRSDWTKHTWLPDWRSLQFYSLYDLWTLRCKMCWKKKIWCEGRMLGVRDQLSFEWKKCMWQCIPTLAANTQNFQCTAWNKYLLLSTQIILDENVSRLIIQWVLQPMWFLEVISEPTTGF